MPEKKPGQLLHKAGVILGGIWVASSILNSTLREYPNSLPKSKLDSSIKSQSSKITNQSHRILLIVKELKQNKPIKKINHNDSSISFISNIILLTLASNGEIRLKNIPGKINIDDRVSKEVTSINKKIQEEGFHISLSIIRDILDINEDIPYGYIVLESSLMREVFNDFWVEEHINIDRLSNIKTIPIKDEGNIHNDSEISILIKTMLKEMEKRSNRRRQELNLNIHKGEIRTDLSKNDLMILIENLRKKKEAPIIEKLF